MIKTRIKTTAVLVPGLLTAAMCLTIAGCRVETNRDGGHDDVKINTPFGDMSVKTNDANVMDGLGLPAYPGAELVHKKGNDDSAADVNMSFGSLQLRVKAVSYRTPDSADKVQAFYRKELNRFGPVLDCVGNHPEGQPTSTPEGLTCEQDNGDHSSALSGHGRGHELKAGSRQHQHIVGIDPDGTGTKFALVALDLPGQLVNGSRQEKTQ